MTANDYGIRKEWAQAWEDADHFSPNKGLADGFLHLLAALMEAEFKREHPIRKTMTFVGAIDLCENSKCGDQPDQRHNYDHDAWLAAARAKLEELGR